MSNDYSLCPVCGNSRSSRDECDICNNAAADKASLEELRRIMTPTQSFAKPDFLNDELPEPQPAAARVEQSYMQNDEQNDPTSSPEAKETAKQTKGLLGLIFGLFGLNK